MPNKNAPTNTRYSGWYNDKVNNVLEWYHNGTKVGQASGSTITYAGAITATTTVAATTTVTAGTGITATTGNITATAGDYRLTAGNYRAGAVSAFAMTEPVSAIVFKTGTAPAGAITTSGGVFSDGTTVKKIIADGTVSDVQT